MDSLRKTYMNAGRLIKPVITAILALSFKVFPEVNSLIRYRSTFGRFPNVIRPKTFNEKIQRRILFDRNPRLKLFSDKFLVRDYVRSRLGDDRYLTKLYGVVTAAEEIRQLDLPPKFVMKPNHYSGLIKIVRDSSGVTPSELESLARQWLRLNYFDSKQQWGYKNVKPRIIFEELLEVNGKIADDYKIYCFNGEPRFINVERDRFGEHGVNYYSLDGSLLPVNRKGRKNFESDKIPTNPEKMLAVARRLSAGVDFVRVDLYDVNGRIVFGELTNYCGGGRTRFDPPEWDEKFGTLWK